jgi:hypothetical protein
MELPAGVEPAPAQLRRLALCPLSYGSVLAGDEGIEPSTRGFGGRRSTTELNSHESSDAGYQVEDDPQDHRDEDAELD